MEDPDRAVDVTLGYDSSSVEAMATATLGDRPVAVTMRKDDSIRAWDLATRQPISRPAVLGCASRLPATATLEGRPVFVTETADGFCVWDLATTRPVRTIPTDVAVYAMATTVVRGRPIAVSGGEDATVRVWDLVTGGQVGRALTGRTEQVCAAAATVWRGRAVAVTGDQDNTVRVWDLADGLQIGPELVFRSSHPWITALSATPEGRLLIGFGPEVAAVAAAWTRR